MKETLQRRLDDVLRINLLTQPVIQVKPRKTDQPMSVLLKKQRGSILVAGAQLVNHVAKRLMIRHGMRGERSKCKLTALLSRTDRLG